VISKLLFFLFVSFAGMMVFGFVLTPAGYLAMAAGGTFLAAVTANALAMRVFERAPLADIGLRWRHGSGRNLGLGLLFGIISAALVTIVPVLLGLAEFVPDPKNPGNLSAAVYLTLMLIIGAAGEEIMIRGYFLQLLVAHRGPALGLALTSVIFGLLHAGNLNVTRLAIVNTVAWGIVLGYAMLRSGDLWLPIGLHFGWNWSLPMAGVQLSGFTMGVTGYALRWKIPDLWSGGVYGPEAGVLTCGVVIALLFALKRTRFETAVPLLFVRPAPEVRCPEPEPPSPWPSS
jgi:membrane protease YdiL (CAAX protease family)